MKNEGFPLVFRISLKAHGLWHLALSVRLSAVGICESVGAKWPLKAAKEDPKADTERPKVAKVRPDVAHKAPSSGKSRKKLSEACPRAAPNHEK